LLGWDGLVTEGIRGEDGRWCVRGAYFPEQEFRAWLPFPEVFPFFPWEPALGIQKSSEQPVFISLIIEAFSRELQVRFSGRVLGMVVEESLWEKLRAEIPVACLGVETRVSIRSPVSLLELSGVLINTEVGPVRVVRESEGRWP
jgi:hypothetical protein